MNDIRFGLRMLAKTPVVATIAALSLAAGIAANTTTFAVANGFLLAPFPFEDQDSLVMVWERQKSNPDDQLVSPGNFLDYRDRTTVFERLVAYDVVPANLTGGETPERVRFVPMSPDTFSMLGRSPLIGRDFEPREGTEGLGNVVVLSYPFWQRYFGEDRGVLGRVVSVDGKSYSIVGVMPKDFDFLPANVDLFRPTSWEDRRDDRERALLVVGRLRQGKTQNDAQAELSAIAAQLERESPDANEGFGVHAIGMRDYFPGRTDTWLMYILMSVAGFVLLIACANVANLLLARAEERQREVAVRTALGAGRGRILRQLLVESVLLALSGGALGTLFSIYSVRWVAQAMPAEIPRSFLPTLDANVLLYTLVVSLLAGIAFGIVPALQTFGQDLREALGESTRGGTATRKRNRLRSLFVVSELAAALALLVGGSALFNLFDEYVLRDPGCRVDGILTTELTASENRHPEDEDLRRFYREVVRRLKDVPGVEAVAAMNELPRSRASGTTTFTIDGRPQPTRNQEPQSGWQAVNDDYFEALEIPILRGRSFTGSDREDGEPVLVVNERFVEMFFPNEDPLDNRVTLKDRSRRIVGVSRTVFQSRMPETGGIPGPVVYLPMEQEPVRSKSLAIVVAGDPHSFGEALRGAVWAVDPEQPVDTLETLDEHIATSLSGPRTMNIVLVVFGATALLLAAIGIYGVMAHGVAQRSREIGIRMALGAGSRDVVRFVTAQGMRLAAVGLLLGAPLAVAILLAIRAAFVGATGATPGVVTAVISILIGVAFVATYLPARRASRIPPVRALTIE